MRRCLPKLVAALSFPQWISEARGREGTKDWRLLFKRCDDKKVVSAWHDLPLRPSSDVGSGGGDANANDCIVHFVSEIAQGTRAKMELIKEEAHNPIGQDIQKKKEGQPLRFFTYGDMPFNYGFIPRTWENPDETDPITRCQGDGDPVDVMHLGPVATPAGAIQPVRVLGILGLIDEGETDWKVITESIADPRWSEYGTLDRIPAEVQKTIIDWFVNYKTTDGKPKNELAFNGEIRGRDEALRIIAECGHQYDGLMKRAEKSPHGYWLR